jgi:hypothetical protein
MRKRARSIGGKSVEFVHGAFLKTESPKVMRWRPISTAPKTGEVRLLAFSQSISRSAFGDGAA